MAHKKLLKPKEILNKRTDAKPNHGTWRRHLLDFINCLILIIFVGCDNTSILSPTDSNSPILFSEELEIYFDQSYKLKPFEPRDIDNDGVIDMPQVGDTYTPPIRLPEVVSSDLPSYLYPEIAGKAGLEATVACKFRVFDDGQVGNVQILRGQEIFRQAAINAVLNLNFTPAEQESNTIAVWILFFVNFKIEK